MDLNAYRIRFNLDSNDWHAHSSERLWAEKLSVGDDAHECFRLLNSPFFSRIVSNQDIVRACRSPSGSDYIFDDVVQHSGRSTYMILIPFESEEKFDVDLWRPFEDLGCFRERAEIETSLGKMILLSIDIPELTNIYDVYELLSEGEAQHNFIFQEGYVGHQLKSNKSV